MSTGQPLEDKYMHGPTWTRRHFLQSAATLAGAGCLCGSRLSTAAALPPSETTRIRLISTPAICAAPMYVAHEFLQQEGFTQIEYVKLDHTGPSEVLASGHADVSADAVGVLLTRIAAGDALVVLAGLHLGCYELFGTQRVRAIRDLKGKTVPIDSLGGPQHVFLSAMTAYVGLDPRKDINWAIHPSDEGMQLFLDGKADAYLGFPPQPQELRARKVGHVVVNTAVDKPWSEYYCCFVAANRDYAMKNPIATKRALRAHLMAADVCASQPERAAKLIFDKGYAPKYEYALETMKEVRYNAWRDYDPNNALRFHALRLHEVGMIKNDPNKLIAHGTDWRFLNELKRELKA